MGIVGSLLDKILYKNRAIRGHYDNAVSALCFRESRLRSRALQVWGHVECSRRNFGRSELPIKAINYSEYSCVRR